METDTRVTEDHATNSTVDWSKSSFLWASKLPRSDNWLVGVSTLPSSLASEGYVCILDWIALTETPIWVQIHPLIAHPGTCSTSFLEWTRLSELGLCYSQIYLVQLQPGCAVTLQSCLPRTAILCDSMSSPSPPPPKPYLDPNLLAKSSLLVKGMVFLSLSQFLLGVVPSHDRAIWTGPLVDGVPGAT